MSIIEATSGNTGIALAALGRFYKHPVYIFMPDWVSKERMNLIKNYGANITYGNGYYSITGSMEKNEFLKILDGIYFKNM